MKAIKSNKFLQYLLIGTMSVIMSFGTFATSASAQYSGYSGGGSSYGSYGGGGYGQQGQQNSTMQWVGVGVNVLNTGVSLLNQRRMRLMAQNDPTTYMIMMQGQAIQNQNNGQRGSVWLGSSPSVIASYGGGNYAR